ncbi:MAG: hypothetical protein EZS28_039485 [Streblomastix strix]|uniref:Uncharacterized protein n=1 Tax=Streblomastix strix TaxID=222440 RepID=A0A5J4U3W0_9EUKA|nr:MAG: hypothetical protein EZS28_039485 [Streblomastix strix]
MEKDIVVNKASNSPSFIDLKTEILQKIFSGSVTSELSIENVREKASEQYQAIYEQFKDDLEDDEDRETVLNQIQSELQKSILQISSDVVHANTCDEYVDNKLRLILSDARNSLDNENRNPTIELNEIPPEPETIKLNPEIQPIFSSSQLEPLYKSQSPPLQLNPNSPQIIPSSPQIAKQSPILESTSPVLQYTSLVTQDPNINNNINTNSNNQTQQESYKQPFSDNSPDLSLLQPPSSQPQTPKSSFASSSKNPLSNALKLSKSSIITSQKSIKSNKDGLKHQSKTGKQFMYPRTAILKKVDHKEAKSENGS